MQLKRRISDKIKRKKTLILKAGGLFDDSKTPIKDSETAPMPSPHSVRNVSHSP